MTQNNTDTKQFHKIPDWLLANEAEAPRDTSRGGSTGFIRKTAAGVSRILREDFLAEKYASRNMLLQAVDPRLKLVTIIALLALAGIVRSPVSLLVLAAAAFMLAMLSGLGASTFLGRVWLIIPLPLLIISLPAATNLLIPGTPLLRIFGSLYISQEGTLAVIRTVLRTGVSLSYCYLLVMTTRWSRLTASLRAFGIPRLFTAILDMAYRFIFVLVQVSIEIFEARYLRTVGKIGNSHNRRFVSGGIALLFAKSSHMGEEIYDAMLGRCYTGEPVGLHGFRLSRNDLVWTVNFAVIVLVALLF